MSDNTRASTTSSRWPAAIVALAPAVLAATLVSHPYLPGRLPNDTEIAAAVAAEPTRWGLVHLATGVASGLVVLAFLAIRSHLREAGEDRFSAVGVPFVVIGSVLFALLPGMEFAPLAAAETGADLAEIAAAQTALQPWFVPTLAIGALAFGIGALSFAGGIKASKVANPRLTALVVGSLVVMAVSRFLPFAVAQFYVQSAASILALWPLAYVMWRQAEGRPATQARPVSTTS
jgi:hypothetical protein